MFNDVVRDIKSLKIQGAANVALSSMDALAKFFSKKDFRTSKELARELEKKTRILLSLRPNEPLLMNSLSYVRKGVATAEEGKARDILENNIRSISLIVREMRDNISSAGANRIKNDSKILTHCHSSSVISLLKMAKDRGIKFEVFNTETRPLLQGRITAKELSTHGIKVHHMVDSAFGSVMSDIDYVMVGCDVITSEISVVNKIGTYPLAVMAKRENVPFYVVAELLKFDPRTIYNLGKIEQRGEQEVWENPPKGVSILNPAFDVTPRELITSFVTEFGVLTPESVHQTVKDRYGWIFD
jgi:ribose 1,5-bisphosphate isomerase